MIVIKKYIIPITCLICIVVSCASQEIYEYKFEQRKEIIDKLIFVELSFLMCEYYIQKEEFPSDKKSFEDYISEHEGNKILNLVHDVDYGFVQTDSSLLMIEDNPVDELDSLIVFSLKLKTCIDEKRKRMEEFYIKSKFEQPNQQTVLIKSKLIELVNRYLKELDPNLEEFPRKGEERRLSIIEVFRDSKEELKIEISYSEHNEKDLFKLREDVQFFLNSNESLFDDIDFIHIPVLYYEKDQLTVY